MEVKSCKESVMFFFFLVFFCKTIIYRFAEIHRASYESRDDGNRSEAGRF